MTTDRKQWWAISAITLAVLGVIVYIGTLHPTYPAPDPIAEDGGVNRYGGWNSDPAAVEVVRGQLAQPWFSGTPAFKAFRGNETDTVLHSDAVKKALGSHLPARDQGGVGSCVSFGTAAAIEYLLCIQIVEAINAGQPPPDFRPLVQEVIYGGSRVEIGGGKIRGDGSVTAWAGKFVREWGVVPRGVHGKFDLTNYSEQRCREYGAKGVPPDLETLAKESPVRQITFAQSAKEVELALRQGYTVAVGSGVGFGSRGPYTRDKDGFLKASGTWGHCMAVVGVRAGKRPGFLFLNSWGENWIGGPKGDSDIPPGSFWVDYATANRMFAEGDTVIFSDASGFPAREIDWFAAAPARRWFASAVAVRSRKDDFLCSALAW